MQAVETWRSRAGRLEAGCFTRVSTNNFMTRWYWWCTPPTDFNSPVSPSPVNTARCTYSSAVITWQSCSHLQITGRGKALGSPRRPVTVQSDQIQASAAKVAFRVVHQISPLAHLRPPIRQTLQGRVETGEDAAVLFRRFSLASQYPPESGR